MAQYTETGTGPTEPVENRLRLYFFTRRGEGGNARPFRDLNESADGPRNITMKV